MVNLQLYQLFMKLVIFLLVLTLLSAERISVDIQNSLLKDDSGRYRFFHGVNAVYKIFPFLPITDHFDFAYSLCEQDFQNLRAWGMNVIRLHVAWEGVEPARGSYNYSYLGQLKKIVQMADKYGISILLDSHQDLFSKKFCGEGFPDWAVKHSKTFPFPLPVKLKRDAHGYPLTSDCLKHPFALFYLSYDVMKFQQDFFTDADGLAQSFAHMWMEVAATMHNQPNVLGYQLINEPSGANMYDYPYNFLWPGVSNNKFLLPFYKQVTKKIRSIDNQKLIFFQPSVVDILGGGFEQTPGGAFQLGKQVLSYHIYCPLVTAEGQPKAPTFCKDFDEITMQYKFQNYKGLGIGGFLTEFGALSNTEKSADEIVRITKFAEDNFQSWVYWQFKYYHDITTAAKPGTTQSFYFENGTLQMAKIRALSHPYATAICGQPISSEYSDTSFSLTFKYGQCENYKYTEIFINQPLYYPDGFAVTFDPDCPKCHLEQIEKSYYKVVAPAEMIGKKLVVKIVRSI